MCTWCCRPSHAHVQLMQISLLNQAPGICKHYGITILMVWFTRLSCPQTSGIYSTIHYIGQPACMKPMQPATWADWVCACVQWISLVSCFDIIVGFIVVPPCSHALYHMYGSRKAAPFYVWLTQAGPFYYTHCDLLCTCIDSLITDIQNPCIPGCL